MTIETEVAALTTATNSLTSAVAIQQTSVDAARALFAATTDTVDNDLNLVDNTADANKPVSTATQTALDAKQVTLISGVNISTINGNSVLSGTPLVVERGATSLESLSYDLRGNLKLDPTAGNLAYVVDDSVVVEGLGMFMWVTTQLEPDDDETCFSTPSSGQWLLVVPAYDLLAAYELVEDSLIDEFIEDQIAAQA
tara:strand:+ start:1007 stop:1597 length:591 start_codon:yes stop_codon:yes gene_type:complete